MQTAPPPPPGASEFATRDVASPLSIADAEEILIRTVVVAFNWPKRQTPAYNTVLDQEDAIVRLHSMAGRARGAGTLYMWGGRWALEPPAARDLAANLAPVKEQLWVFDSDVGNEQSVGAVVALIEKRRLWVDLRGRKKEVNDHYRRSTRFP